jgi:hypothetical protein
VGFVLLKNDRAMTTHPTTTHTQETTTMSTTGPTPIDPPPASANIPSVPAGFTRASPGESRIVAPRKSELAAVPQALIDPSKFASFDSYFAGIGITRAQFTQKLLSGSLWSSMRLTTAEWDQ